MNLQNLLRNRAALLRHARLANLAFAHEQLREFARQLQRAGVYGPVTILHADLRRSRLTPVLVASDASPAVVEEHFLEETIAQVADALRLLTQDGFHVRPVFTADELQECLLPLVRHRLEREGVMFHPEAHPADESPHERT